MGNNLLDALKNAGLADAKKAKKAEQAKKQQQHKELKSGAPKAAAPEVVEAPVDRTQAIQNVGDQVRERLAAIYKNAELPNISGRKKFYFQTLDNFIDCMMLSDVAAALLERGKYALVASENLDDYLLVKRATALSIEAIDKKRIIVLRRQES